MLFLFFLPHVLLHDLPRDPLRGLLHVLSIYYLSILQYYPNDDNMLQVQFSSFYRVSIVHGPPSNREQRLPFELSVDPFYSEQNQARLRKSIAEMEATGGTIHEVKFDD